MRRLPVKYAWERPGRLGHGQADDVTAGARPALGHLAAPASATDLSAPEPLPGVICTSAALLLVAVGLKTTLIVQLAPTARFAGQSCVCAN